jgi:DNA-directed RNA polymerase I, II, and III subunit RPABC2
MSDYSDSESSDNESVVIVGQKKTKTPINKNNIDAYNDDDEISEIDENEEQENDDIKIGGEDSDLEEGEIKEENESDIDEAVNNDSEVENDYEDEDEDEDQEQQQQSKAKTPKPLKDPANKKMVPLPNYSDDDEDDDDDDENYLQKFDNEITKNYIQEYHPECFVHNYEEIAQLTKVVRNSDNIIIDPLHKTIPFLTKYEKTRVLGQRAKQIESGAKPFVRVPENVVDGYVIAELELQQKRIPFVIRRPLPNGGSEYWNLRDLEII